MPIMAMTTNNSTRVKPDRRAHARFDITKPFDRKIKIKNPFPKRRWVVLSHRKVNLQTTRCRYRSVRLGRRQSEIREGECGCVHTCLVNRARNECQCFAIDRRKAETDAVNPPSVGFSIKISYEFHGPPSLPNGNLTNISSSQAPSKFLKIS